MSVFNKAGYIQCLFFIFIASMGCDSRTGRQTDHEYIPQTSERFPVSYVRGMELVHSNCSGCHSRQTDTTEAKTTLYDLYERDSLSLYSAIETALEDTIHKGRTPYRCDPREIEGLVLYIRHLYAPKY